MTSPNLVLLHAPSIYDFRQETVLYGPLGDFVLPPFALDRYPLTYGALAGHLERNDYRVRIVNLARHMLTDSGFDAEGTIASLEPLAFGIDLHWLAHVQGALAVAQIVKTFHPDTPVVLMGQAATHYHAELINYPQVDYVLRGDSTENALLSLMQSMSQGQMPGQIPSLTWRTRAGQVMENPMAPPSESLDDLDFSGEWRWTDSSMEDGWPGCVPFARQTHAPFSVSAMARGCTHHCTQCGTSAHAARQLNGRCTPAYRSPERLAEDVYDAQRHRDGAAYVAGDITQNGMDYARRFIRALGGFPDLVCFDLFQPAPRELLDDMARALPQVALEIPMDSHDPHIREAIGRPYNNSAVEKTIEDALSLGYAQVRLYFTIGLPCQDYDSVMDTVAYCDELLTGFKGDGRLQPFVAPLMPFLDPGSLAFEEPEQTGYRLLFGTLEEHRRALLTPSWKHALNYETVWMSRDDIARATYDSTGALAQIRAKHGFIPAGQARKMQESVVQAHQLMAEIDQAMALDDTERLQDTLSALKPRIDAANRAGLWNQRLSTWRQDDIRRSTVDDRAALGSVRRAWLAVREWWQGRSDHQVS